MTDRTGIWWHQHLKSHRTHFNVSAFGFPTQAASFGVRWLNLPSEMFALTLDLYRSQDIRGSLGSRISLAAPPQGRT